MKSFEQAHRDYNNKQNDWSNPYKSMIEDELSNKNLDNLSFLAEYGISKSQLPKKPKLANEEYNKYKSETQAYNENVAKNKGNIEELFNNDPKNIELRKQGFPEESIRHMYTMRNLTVHKNEDGTLDFSSGEPKSQKLETAEEFFERKNNEYKDNLMATISNILHENMTNSIRDQFYKNQQSGSDEEH